MSSDAKRSRRSWAAWARAGSIAMAVLAFASLGATVVASQRALSDASDVVIRGEGDLLLADVVADLADETAPITPATLARVLDANASSGLRYVALVDRDGAIVAEAGSAVMANAPQKPGEARIEGRRARVVGFLAGRRRAPH